MQFFELKEAWNIARHGVLMGGSGATSLEDEMIQDSVPLNPSPASTSRSPV